MLPSRQPWFGEQVHCQARPPWAHAASMEAGALFHLPWLPSMQSSYGALQHQNKSWRASGCSALSSHDVAHKAPWFYQRLFGVSCLVDFFVSLSHHQKNTGSGAKSLLSEIQPLWNRGYGGYHPSPLQWSPQESKKEDGCSFYQGELGQGSHKHISAVLLSRASQIFLQDIICLWRKASAHHTHDKGICFANVAKTKCWKRILGLLV